jgi:hypothetical protein
MFEDLRDSGGFDPVTGVADITLIVNPLLQWIWWAADHGLRNSDRLEPAAEAARARDSRNGAAATAIGLFLRWRGCGSAAAVVAVWPLFTARARRGRTRTWAPGA